MPRTRRARLRPVPPRPALEYAGDSMLHDFQVFRKRARRRPWMVAKKDFHRHDMPRLRALVEAGPTFRFPEPRLVYVVEPWRRHFVSKAPTYDEIVASGEFVIPDSVDRRACYIWTRIVHLESREARYLHEGNFVGDETRRQGWRLASRTRPLFLSRA